jgi:hypothetical protein
MGVRSRSRGFNYCMDFISELRDVKGPNTCSNDVEMGQVMNRVNGNKAEMER